MRLVRASKRVQRHDSQTQRPHQRRRERRWKFETLEHGGEYPDMMPQAIRATDAKGRSCLYVPISVNGKVVDSKGFVFDSAEKARVEYSPNPSGQATAHKGQG